jgi:hypothetical protein
VFAFFPLSFFLIYFQYVQNNVGAFISGFSFPSDDNYGNNNKAVINEQENIFLFNSFSSVFNVRNQESLGKNMIAWQGRKRGREQ